MKKENICTVLINSCDSYEDTWTPFFYLLKKYWPNRTFPIVLNTETKHYDYDNMNVKTFSLYNNNKVSWGKRLRETLQHIDSKYVLCILDDFFLEDYVDNDQITKCINWMENDENIAVFSFMPVPGQNINNNKYDRFELRNQDGEYRFNCQAAIWRRERLIEFVRDHENPWEWELLGSIRSQRYNDEFYSLIDGCKKIFDYDLQHGGAVHRGKWVKEVILPICDREKINIDFDIRGFENDLSDNEKNSKRKSNFFMRIYNHIKYHWHKIITKYRSLR